MKKRIGSLLLSLALCLSLLPAAALAAEGEHSHYLCGGDTCSGDSHSKESSETTFAKKISQQNDNLYIDGTKWTYTYSGSSHQYTLPAGNYYLGTDIKIKGSIQIKSTATLCLNGYTITSTEDIVINVINGEFTLTDCKGESTEYGKITHSNNNGRGVYVNNGTFNMYGGSITRNMANGGNGGGVRVDSGTFNMYGGSITGNNAKALSNRSGGNGGGVCVNSGAFNMYGGEVHNNTTTGTDDTTTGHGGGVYVGGGTFTMQNGSISSNKVSDGKDGGGVYVNGGTFNMSGGSITGNTAPTTGDGGGVFVNEKCAFNMSGGTISGNTGFRGGGVSVERSISSTTHNPGAFTMSSGNIADNNAMYGGGVYISGNFAMSGGEISGNTATGNANGVYVNKDSTFTISGAPKITDNTPKGSTNNVYLTNGASITIGDDHLSRGASIGVTTENNPSDNTPITIATNATSGDVDYFSADTGTNYEFKLNGGKILMSEKGTSPTPSEPKKHTHPICGETCGDDSHGSETWQPIGTESELTDISESGCYYLTKNIELSGSWTPAGGVKLCLNGKTITGANGQEAIRVKSEFTLTDCNESTIGKITHATGQKGCGVFVISEDTFHMYGGSITGNKATHGGGVYVNGGKFNMYGGTIGGTGNDANTATYGGVYVYNGSFIMSGGSITGNRATNSGGGVYVDIGTFEMSGSAGITGNSATNDGGGVCMSNVNSSSITVSGAVKITGNYKGGSASNVYLPNDKTITIGTDGLASDAQIGVTTQNTPTEEAPITIATSANENDRQRFTADAGGGYRFTLNNGEVKLVNGTVAAKTLSSIAVTTAPTKTTYTASENFDSAGMVVTATYSDSSTAPVTGYTVTDGNALTAGKTSVTISYTEGGVTKTTTQTITVNAALSEFTITFDGNGGTPSTSSMTTTSQKLTSLPNASRSSYTFDGWYTTASSGTQITTTYAFSADTTVYAHWTYNGGTSSGGSSGSSTYTITAPGKTDNGSVSTNVKNAKAGDTVTVTVTPDKGYVLETLTVLDKNGKELKLTDKGDGKYTFTMPAGKVEVKATFMDDNTMLNYFVDVKSSDYFYDAVLWAAQKGITKGINDAEFGPSQSCTRAQIVTFLWRVAGSPEPNSMDGFSDVSARSYYAKAVAWAIENGITTGTGNGKFDPDAVCTRAQAAAFLYRASGSPAVSGGSAFGDVAENAYYADAVAWAEKNGVTEGIGGGLFGSGNDCTRAQIVTFLYRTYQEK